MKYFFSTVISINFGHLIWSCINNFNYENSYEYNDFTIIITLVLCPDDIWTIQVKKQQMLLRGKPYERFASRM